MGNMVTNVYAKFNCDRLRIDKALGIFRKLTTQPQQQQCSRILARDHPPPLGGQANDRWLHDLTVRPITVTNLLRLQGATKMSQHLKCDYSVMPENCCAKLRTPIQQK